MPKRLPLSKRFQEARLAGSFFGRKFTPSPYLIENKIIRSLMSSGLSDYRGKTSEEREIIIHMVRSRPEVMAKAITHKKAHPKLTWAEAWLHTLHASRNRYPGKKH